MKEEKIIKVKATIKFPELNNETEFVEHHYFNDYLQIDHFREGTFMIITKEKGKGLKVYNIDNPRNNYIQGDDKKKHIKKEKQKHDVANVPEGKRSNKEVKEFEKLKDEQNKNVLKQLEEKLQVLREESKKDKELIQKLTEDEKDLKKDSEELKIYKKDELLNELFYSFRHEKIKKTHFYYKYLLDQIMHINQPNIPWSELSKNFNLGIYVLGGYSVYQHIRGQEIPKDVKKNTSTYWIFKMYHPLLSEIC